MAKKFGGFTPQQQQTLLSKMGYNGPAQQDDLNKFMMSSPQAASMMGKYAQMAKARVAGVSPVGMAEGGITTSQKSTGEADYTVYNFGGKEYRSMAEAQAAASAYNSSLSGPDKATDQQQVTTTTPNTTGGFDMSGLTETATTATPAVEPVTYDPATGLPTSPGTADTAIASAFDEAPESFYVNKVDFENNKQFAIDQSKELVDNAAIMDNPDSYVINRKGNTYYIDYPDGTSINTGYNGVANAEARAKGLAEALKITSANKAATDIYTNQLDTYKQYQSGQAGAALDDTRATLDAAQSGLAQEQNLMRQYATQLANMDADDPQREVLQGLIDEQQVKVTNAKANLSQAQTNVERVGMPSTTELRADTLEDPTSRVTEADVVTVSDTQREAGKMAGGVGQAPATAEQATLTEAAIAADVPLAQEFAAANMTAKEAATEVADVMSKLTAVTGKPSAEALAEAATMNPQQLAQLGLTVEQIDRARRVEQVAPLEVTPEMQVSSAVDFERAKAETNFAAATGVPSTEATVQGQLTSLMEQFEDGETPAWAAGAIRAASQRMAQRGLSASSMAGQAIVQAAMESALPIAQQDAQTRASFEAQNLSNRQQSAMFAAEQRSKFLGIEFDQEFQSRVQNAARIADVAQINFTAEQQVALENARMAQTVDITNLTAKNAKVMADAAAMSQLDLANLSNRQQANVQNAQAFLQFDMTSMSNQQQVAMFKAQSLASVFMSDTAAENASRQFNASSDNQVDMFFSNLQTQIQQFNNEQSNAMERFNAGEANAISQFNAAQQNARDQFNANNALVVEQANAQWEQAITTMDNAAQNQANRDAAQQANNLTETTYNNMLQQERDVLDYAWRSSESALARENNLLVAEMQRDSAASTAKGAAAGKVAAVATEFLLKKIF